MGPAVADMMEALDIAEKLRPRLRSDFLGQLLSGSLQSAAHEGNPLRLTNFSNSFRELFRHLLVELAPDHQVEACRWFKPDPLARGKVTRGQKASYVVHGGLPPTYVHDELGIDIAAERAGLIETIDRLNKYTHVNPESIGSSPEDVARQVLEACKALQSFLDCADKARGLLCQRVEERIHDDVVSEAISETIDSVDELATHHTIEDVEVHEVEVTCIDHDAVHFKAYGTVGVSTVNNLDGICRVFDQAA